MDLGHHCHFHDYVGCYLLLVSICILVSVVAAPTSPSYLFASTGPLEQMQGSGVLIVVMAVVVVVAVVVVAVVVVAVYGTIVAVYTTSSRTRIRKSTGVCG